MKKRESEKNLERELVRRAGRMGCLALKFASGTETGYPDRLVLTPGGRAEWVELKSEGERPTLLQRIRHEQLRRMGFRVEVVHTRAELLRYLDGLEEGLGL